MKLELAFPRDEVALVVREVLADALDRNTGDIGLDTSLVDHLGMDSMTEDASSSHDAEWAGAYPPTRESFRYPLRLV